jgi:hypothetical protein
MHVRVIVLATLATATAAAGPRCPRVEDEWLVVRGELARARDCGTSIAITDASDTPFVIGGTYQYVSLARFERREPIDVPFELAFDWQWLTPGRWGLEIDALGIDVLLGVDSIGFYIDDAQLMATTFEPFPAWSSAGVRHIVVRRTEREVVVLVDGNVVGRKALDARPRTGHPAIGLRGAPAERTRGSLRAVHARRVTAR